MIKTLEELKYLENIREVLISGKKRLLRNTLLPVVRTYSGKLNVLKESKFLKEPINAIKDVCINEINDSTLFDTNALNKIENLSP